MWLLGWSPVKTPIINGHHLDLREEGGSTSVTRGNGNRETKPTSLEPACFANVLEFSTRLGETPLEFTSIHSLSSSPQPLLHFSFTIARQSGWQCLTLSEIGTFRVGKRTPIWRQRAITGRMQIRNRNGAFSTTDSILDRGRSARESQNNPPKIFGSRRRGETQRRYERIIRSNIAIQRE